MANSEQSNTKDASDLTSPSSNENPKRKPRVAFISGHIDLPNDIFMQHYRAALDSAIAAGESFILSNAGGADSMALEYLLSQEVATSRITVFIHTPPARRQKPGGSNAKMHRVDELRTGPATLKRYRTMGFQTRVVDGWHTERDAVMTRESDYDILWVRPEEETRVLYGKKYRAGRVSGTQKNMERRALLPAAKVVGDGDGDGNGEIGLQP